VGPLPKTLVFFLKGAMVDKPFPALLRGPLLSFEFDIEKLGYFDPIFFIFCVGRYF
jgi:hypothetical protein